MADFEQRRRDRQRELRSLAGLGLRLGVTSFGGPAAHIAMLRHEAVERRGWLTDRHFLDLIGVTNLIPGPNSTEMVMHVGHLRAGRIGLAVAGAAFIMPAAAITLLFAWLYLRFGATPSGEWLLRGIQPVIIAVVAQALWNLGRTAIGDLAAAAVGAGVVALYLLGINEIVLLFGGAAGLILLRRVGEAIRPGEKAASFAPIGLVVMMKTAAAMDGQMPYSWVRLFLTFLKIGSVLYGSGYVLLAFLRNDFVVRYGWLTERQLLDAVAVGQITPGPVFTTATFVGYLVGGFGGAVAATIGIFLPAFVLVAVVTPHVDWVRSRPAFGRLLDGVNVAAIGLMAAVGLTLGREAIVDMPTALIAVVAGYLLIFRRINSAWLVAGGGVCGLVLHAL